MAIRIVRDVVFATPQVGFNGGKGPLAPYPIKLDAYLPEGSGPSPALVLAFGGAFHRGSKETDEFTDGVGTSTPMSDYCRYYAERGYACFSLQYRLAQTDPEPPASPVLQRPEAVSLARASVVRQLLGLGPISVPDMARAMEAAYEDVATGVRYVIEKAGELGVDPARVVVGGFSAGGRAAVYTAYAKRVPVAGVVSISGPMAPEDAAHWVKRGAKHPPLLKVTGEKDLEHVVKSTPAMLETLGNAGVACEWCQVPAGTHFYAASATAADGRTVRDTITAALKRWGV
jgi:acetyl esterase/lipase